MTSIAAPRRRRERREADRQRSSVLSGGVVWIIAVGLFLAGVVAVNVAVLRLNVELDQLGRERAQLKADIASTRAQLSTASAATRVGASAEARLGLVPADPALTTYVTIAPGR